MALTRVHGRVVYPHGEDTPTPVTGNGVIEYVHASPGIIGEAVHGPDRHRTEYVDGVAGEAWLKAGMWRAYVYPSEGRSYTLHLGIPEGGDVTLADVVGEVVPEGIVTKGEPGEPGEPGQDGHTPEITFDGTTIVVDGVPGPDLKGEPGEGGGGAGVDIQVGGEQPASGWWLDTSGSFMPPNEDTTPPVVGELGVSAGSRSVTLTVTGASDDRAGLMYAFSNDNGANYTDWQSDAEYVFTGLTPGAGYAFRHKVRDQAGNETVGAAVPTTLPEFQSAFRDAVLALNPWQYWPLDDPVGTPRASLRNLGSASGMDANGYQVKRDLDVLDGTLGAETLGDGNTAALLGSNGFTVLRTSVDLHLHDWTFLFLVKVTEPVGASTSLLWEPTRAFLHDSGNLIVVTIPATGTKMTPVSIPRAEWGGVHMITVTKSAARTAVYWDDILIGYVDGPSTVDEITSLAAGRVPGVYSSIVYLQGQALSPVEVAALHATLSEEGTA